MTAERLRCGNCRQAMRPLALEAHYGQRVQIDLCGPCHLVWFDTVESARLTGLAMLDLLGEMVSAQREPHEVLRAAVGCPRCAGPLNLVHNQTRWGRTLQLECHRRHGAYQTFSQFLSEKGLIRPLSSADRAALMQREGGLACLNCGAALGAGDQRCSYCDALPGMVDVARLARALDPDGATESHAVHRTAARHASLHCVACGAPLPAGPAVQCGHCKATLATGQLAQAHAAVSELSAALQVHRTTPAPHVRAKRLAQLSGDLPRRWEDVRKMQSEAQAPAVDTDVELWPLIREHPWVSAVVAALVLSYFYFSER